MSMTFQNYEEYWKLTLEYTDIHSGKFIGTLQLIVDYIDSHDMSTYDKDKYRELQQIVKAKFPKSDDGSVRKSINQFIKLGFVNFQLKSYHENTKDFLSAKTNRKRQSIFSKIVYTNSSFNRGVTEDSNLRQINFLIKTLEENGHLSKNDIVALMMVPIDQIEKGYLTREELNKGWEKAQEVGFLERKYNQVQYLWNILNKLDDLAIESESLYFLEDAQVLFEEREKVAIRDPYLQRIYKNRLKEETEEQFGGKAKCMVEGLAYPALIASHIKPYIKSNESEAFDPFNGLLLSKNMDSLFDQGYISFTDGGQIIASSRLDLDLNKNLGNFKLNPLFLNEKRREYLEFHRKNQLIP